MIVLLAQYQAKKGKGFEIVELLREMAPLVKAHEPGCWLYQISIEQENPDSILIYEHYEDQAAIDAHRETAHFKEIIIEKIVPLIAKREVSFYDLTIS